jgi:multidrug efflux pump subunit AcrB
MFFLSGVAKYLFVPLAEAVVFAMLASYFWSRTIVPTMAKYMLKERASGNGKGIKQREFDRRFDAIRNRYQCTLTAVVQHRGIVIQWSLPSAFRHFFWCRGLDRISSRYR